jgi:hypothetical protein
VASEPRDQRGEREATNADVSQSKTEGFRIENNPR